MWRETNLFGIFISPLIVYMVAAALIYLPIRFVLIRLRAFRWVWNAALTEAGIYVSILGALVLWL
ncbi:DUF1656 domain-containing protein [Rhodopila sp.]|uniref:DUF1656 domain-containing protein n=1 Tax=Rhodopila sp. TaxID=2480087 RepID=UPI003D0F6BB1